MKPLPAGELGTVVTLAAMADVARRSAEMPSVRAAAESIRSRVGGGAAYVLAVSRWIHDSVSFRSDAEQRGPGVEYVRAPGALIREIRTVGASAGDCDDAATLAVSLLLAVVPRSWRLAFVITSDEPTPGAGYQHVFWAVDSGAGWRLFDPQEVRRGKVDWHERPDCARLRFFEVAR